MRYRRHIFNPIWIILILNLILVIVSYIYPGIILYFGLVPQYFLNRPWTIVTSIFVHSGLWHFIANMLTFYFLGSYLSRLIGYSILLIIYLSGGILGGIFYLFLGEPLSIVIGASGAVFAVGGALTVMRPKLKVMVFPVPIPLSLWIAVVGAFAILSFVPYVAWEAHLGGLITGLIAGCIYRRIIR